MGRDGNGEISLRATWDQGGRILSQQGGFQVSGRGHKGGISKGRKKQRDSAMYIVNLNVYSDIIIACKCLNDCQLYICR
jgi:hypothetical protein